MLAYIKPVFIGKTQKKTLVADKLVNKLRKLHLGLHKSSLMISNTLVKWLEMIFFFCIRGFLFTSDFGDELHKLAVNLIATASK